MLNYDEYQTPLASRYASNSSSVILVYNNLLTWCLGVEMKKIFSSRERATTWRKLWLWLAEAEKEVGLTQITDKAIEAIRKNLVVSDEAFQVIAAEERIRRHDVMSHVFALEKDAPDAAGLIHIGATSCYG
ncbi:MAG: adenylosuccinase ade13 [Icmadophila ericetorum]|nr:adenylosuccinase ade13 [Icmadophila ericetorum]